MYLFVPRARALQNRRKEEKNVFYIEGGASKSKISRASTINSSLAMAPVPNHKWRNIMPYYVTLITESNGIYKASFICQDPSHGYTKLLKRVRVEESEDEVLARIATQLELDHGKCARPLAATLLPRQCLAASLRLRRRRRRLPHLCRRPLVLRGRLHRQLPRRPAALCPGPSRAMTRCLSHRPTRRRRIALPRARRLTRPRVRAR
jgi:hypothetical protein